MKIIEIHQDGKALALNGIPDNIFSDTVLTKNIINMQ